MKLTKKNLSALIKEELNLFEAKWDVDGYDKEEEEEVRPDRDQITPDERIKKMEDEETNDAGDAYWVMVDDLVTSIGRQAASRVNGTEDEVYIMTGQSEGITVKVLRRGR
jgi:hypothetical protein